MGFFVLSVCWFVFWFTHYVYIRKITIDYVYPVEGETVTVTLNLTSLGEYISYFSYQPVFYSIILTVMFVCFVAIKHYLYRSVRMMVVKRSFRIRIKSLLELIYAIFIAFIGYQSFPRLSLVIIIVLLMYDAINVSMHFNFFSKIGERN